jgi:hypothetical protein
MYKLEEDATIKKTVFSSSTPLSVLGKMLKKLFWNAVVKIIVGTCSRYKHANINSEGVID